jgi:hypothetical protein
MGWKNLSREQKKEAPINRLKKFKAEFVNTMIYEGILPSIKSIEAKLDEWNSNKNHHGCQIKPENFNISLNYRKAQYLFEELDKYPLDLLQEQWPQTKPYLSGWVNMGSDDTASYANFASEMGYTSLYKFFSNMSKKTKNPQTKAMQKLSPRFKTPEEKIDDSPQKEIAPQSTM